MEANPTVEPGARDDAASLLSSHRGLLLRRARAYSICPDDADDALQRAVEILLRAWPTVKRRSLVPWMLTVVSREAMAVRRKRLRELGVGPPADGPHPLGRLASHEPGPAERAEHGERLAGVARLLARLKPQERRALTLQAQGYSYAEIQAITGWTHTKVNRCLAEGRARLRQLGTWR